MIIFGYGSLLNNASLNKTIGEPLMFGQDVLSGYKRVFDFKSPSRKNLETGVYSSVLNLQPDKAISIVGVLFQVATHKFNELLERERGYDVVPVKLESGKEVVTFMSKDHECYEFIQDDPVQQEYLELCLAGAKNLGPAAYENFLDTTFIGSLTVRQVLDM